MTQHPENAASQVPPDIEAMLRATVRIAHEFEDEQQKLRELEHPRPRFLGTIDAEFRPPSWWTRAGWVVARQVPWTMVGLLGLILWRVW